MIKALTILMLASLANHLYGQINYEGFVGKFPIELVTDISSDGDARAVYCYRKFDEPIAIDGRLNHDTLTLFEKDKQGKTTATLIFLNFSGENNTVSGTWKNLLTKSELPIKLNKEFELKEGSDITWENREIIQKVSLDNYYFKIVVSKAKDAYYPEVKAANIYQKKTDSLVQSIPVDCQLIGLDNIEVGDYNFDGMMDFSIFESSYSGGNTSSIYFLYNPSTKKYFDSKFEGVSLEFDQKAKRISERNSCCGGRLQTTATYKVVNNNMILVDQHCFIWDDKKQELVERSMKDCQ